MLWSRWSLLFFFFQAEDGIRDLTVTGVQTCALPIASPRRREPPDPSHTRTGFGSRCAGPPPAMAEGVDAGAACSSRVNNETITRTAFRLPKLSRPASGESRLGRLPPRRDQVCPGPRVFRPWGPWAHTHGLRWRPARGHVAVALAIRHEPDADDDEENQHDQNKHAPQHDDHESAHGSVRHKCIRVLASSQ